MQVIQSKLVNFNNFKCTWLKFWLDNTRTKLKSNLMCARPCKYLYAVQYCLCYIDPKLCYFVKRFNTMWRCSYRLDTSCFQRFAFLFHRFLKLDTFSPTLPLLFKSNCKLKSYTYTYTGISFLFSNSEKLQILGFKKFLVWFQLFFIVGQAGTKKLSFIFWSLIRHVSQESKYFGWFFFFQCLTL